MITERAFWSFVWLAGVRLPWATMPPWTALRAMAIGCTTLVVARYIGWNLLARRWIWDRP